MGTEHGIPSWTADSFWLRVQKGPRDQCWPWTGAKGSNGYGRVKVRGRLMSPHRVAYELTHGPIPAGKGYHGTVVMHSCDRGDCCNPAHLSLGTQRENMRDCRDKGRLNTGRAS